MRSALASSRKYKTPCTWYDAPPSERVTKLRDVHPYNVVNDAQLAQEGLFLWQVEESALPELRSQLAESEALIH